MRKVVWITVLALSLGLAACFESKLDACLSEPSYDCLMDQALKAANDAGTDTLRAAGLAYAVRVMAVTGDREAATSNLAVIAGLVDAMPASDGRERMLAMVVRAHAMMDRLDQAQAYAATIGNSYSAGLAYAWLAENQFRLGDEAGGRQSVERALALASGLTDAERSAVLSRIAAAEATAGEGRRTLEIAGAAREAAMLQGSLMHRVAALSTAAGALARAGYPRESLDYLQAVSDTLEALQRSSGESNNAGNALSFLAAAQAEAGEITAARLTLGKLIEWIPRERRPMRRSVLLAAAALVQAEIR